MKKTISSVQAFSWARQLSKTVNVPLIRFDVKNGDLPLLSIDFYPAFFYSANYNKMLFCVFNEHKTMHFWEVDNYKELFKAYPILSELYIENGEQLYLKHHSSKPIVAPTLS